MKSLLLCAAMAAASPSPAQEIVRVEVDGVMASYDGTPPEIRSGRVLVPVRGTFEQIGARVNWDPVQRVVTAEKDGRVLIMKIGESTAVRGQEVLRLDVPPQIIEGRTLIPLRFVSEALGAHVHWDGLERIVTIKTKEST